MALDTKFKQEVAGVHADAPAENLLVRQYRYWMTGYATRKMTYCDLAWEALVRTVPADAAKVLFAEIHSFTRVLRDQAKREIGFLPDLCRCICHDESLLLFLVRASQIDESFAETLAASELLGTHKVEALVSASRSLAEALASRGLLLEPIEEMPSWLASILFDSAYTLH
jgi:hypothetical protein